MFVAPTGACIVGEMSVVLRYLQSGNTTFDSRMYVTMFKVVYSNTGAVPAVNGGVLSCCDCIMCSWPF